MSRYLKHLPGLAFAVGLALATGVVTWLATRAPAKSSAPAKPEPPSQVLKEADLIVVTLKPEAERRLGLQVVPVERRQIPHVRNQAGEVMVPPGQAITVSAPLTGVVRAHGGERIRPGQRVTKGQPVAVFTPVLSPDARTNLAISLVDAEGQVKSARTQVEAATIALNRARQLFTQEAGTRRALDDATAQAELARKALEAAEARRDLLANFAKEADTGAVTSQTIQAPAAGVVRNIQALAGETVPGGAALFEILVLDTLWVRVPVYVGEWKDIDTHASARIGPLAEKPGAPTTLARLAAAPPSAELQSATVDLYYELVNPREHFFPGQRVGAALPVRGRQAALVVPWSAVLHDINGGTWVYEQLEPRRYVRRYVTVRQVVNEIAVLDKGPAEGTLVVKDAVAELFGTEVGFAK